MGDPSKEAAWPERVGAILVRLVVPAWICVGAVFKVVGSTPKSLPRSVLDMGEAVGFSDHFLLLAVLIAIEFIFVGIMLFVGSLARLAAVFMLGVFCLILIIEMINGAESCGCLGQHSLPPQVMFAIDFALLLGVVIFKPRSFTKSAIGPILATIFTIATAGTTFGVVLSHRTTDAGLPASWYPRDLATWDGRNIDDIDLFSMVKQWPHDLHNGPQYVIFYGRTCDHCEDLLYEFFSTGVPVPTTLVAIPESKEGFSSADAFESPCYDCAETQLPIGVDWIISTPLVVAIDDGIVRCAKENEEYEDPTCLIW